jgi:flagellar biosynthetic protein FlhB
MAEENDPERTESPSERRLERAREQGQVARSRELSTFLLMVCSGAMLLGVGGSAVADLEGVMRAGLTLDHADAFRDGAMLARFQDLSVHAMAALMPLFLALIVTAIGAAVLLGGWVFSSSTFAPQFSRINPGAGLSRMVSGQGAIELAKAILKSVLLAAIGAGLLWQSRADLLNLGAMDLNVALAKLGATISRGLLWLCGGLAIIAMVDVPVQILRRLRSLRMTRQEVRDENRELLGDPRLKARIRNLQRTAARRRMMAQVPKADVVVVNPSHFAVALEYKESMRAPRVIAKGVDLIALRIREIATENNVPLMEAPPLARALYRHTEIDQEIPVALYEAVAQVMAYTMQLRRWRSAGGASPLLPHDLPIPDGLDPGIEVAP